MTASGYTTSSQDTQSTTKKPLEEAPFHIYLAILREQGYQEDADISEQFYLETLKPYGYAEDIIYKTQFKNLLKAVEIILEGTQREITEATQNQTPITLSGDMVLGEGADKLTPQQLQQLMMRQMLLHEEEKTKLIRG